MRVGLNADRFAIRNFGENRCDYDAAIWNFHFQIAATPQSVFAKVRINGLLDASTNICQWIDCLFVPFRDAANAAFRVRVFGEPEDAPKMRSEATIRRVVAQTASRSSARAERSGCKEPRCERRIDARRACSIKRVGSLVAISPARFVERPALVYRRERARSVVKNRIGKRPLLAYAEGICVPNLKGGY